MKAIRHTKIDWWVGGAFMMGLGGVAMDIQATFTGLVVLVLGILALVIGWRLPTPGERTRQRLLQLCEAAAILCRKLPSGMMLVDHQDRVLFANEHALSMFGVTADSLVGQKLQAWEESLPSDPQKLPALPARRFHRADGHGFYAHVSEAPVELPNEPALSGLKILVISDISAWVDMHRRIQQAERLRTAATMATQFAHEVRNPVAAISGSAQVLGKLQRQLADPHAQHAISESDRALLYECIVHESDRLDGIIAKFLSVSEFSEERMDELLQQMEEGEDLLRPFTAGEPSRRNEPIHAA